MEIIRDPLWNNIRVDDLALQLIDTPVFQRLRYIRQVGLAHLVYPGATHTRFEHALGAYHLCKRVLAIFKERDELDGISDTECTITYLAALLHDVGHYPFSHALEEIGAVHHEQVAYALITGGEIGHLLRERVTPDAPERIFALIRGTSNDPLQGLISGSLDLDKIEYLNRDAHACGVPYGDIDADRLMNSLALVRDPNHGECTIGVFEKGLSALESLLFAKYQMYRNVYWHHAVRSATAMYKRLVEDAWQARAVTNDTLAGFTDEGLLFYLQQHAPSPLLDGIRNRRLYKRVAQWSASELEGEFGEWISNDRQRTRAAEDAIARELGLQPGELILDYPEKTQMLGLDIPVVRRNGSVFRLTGEGLTGAIDLPRISHELYQSARWLRVFAARRMDVSAKTMMAMIARA